MKIITAVLVLAPILSQQSCYPVKAYHLDSPVISLTPNITLAYIEFDDNGEMYDQPSDLQNPKSVLVRKELDETIQKIHDLETGHHGNGINVVVFIHGWKNNAGDTDNVAGFQAFLQQVYNSYADTPDPAPLMGIYIGWRGASVRVAKDLSYWSRTNTTLRVAGPHLEEALFRIIRTVKSPQSAGETSSNLIMIGHSFGGRILERAMTSYFESRILASDGERLQGCVAPPVTMQEKISLAQRGKPVSGWQETPDLTVLLNEAAPATDAKQFLEFLRCHGIIHHRDGHNFPLFLSITSDGDAATGIALPIGQTVARLEMKTRPYAFPDPSEIPNQSTYFIHSTANIPALHSHELRSGECLSGEHEVSFTGSILGRYRLCEVPFAGKGVPYWNHTPYWITKIPVAIVPDHSDIFRPDLYGFLRAFLPSPEAMRNPRHRDNAPQQRTLRISQ